MEESLCTSTHPWRRAAPEHAQRAREREQIDGGDHKSRRNRAVCHQLALGGRREEEDKRKIKQGTERSLLCGPGP